MLPVLVWMNAGLTVAWVTIAVMNLVTMRKIKRHRAELAAEIEQAPAKMMANLNALMGQPPAGGRVSGVEMLTPDGHVMAQAGDIPVMELKPGKEGWQ